MCRVCDFEALELPGTCCPTHGQPLVSPALRGRPPLDERYVLIDPLDEGAFAEVFLAFDRQAPVGEAALVAIKQLKHDQRGAEVRARFRREGEMLHRLLGHPGIVGLRGMRHDGDVQYLALEYVDGVNLERLIAERRRLPAAKAARVVMAVLDVLDHLHARGVIHRDLKPNNIMVQAIGDGPDEPTTVRLLDLGIARRIDEENAMLPLITRRGWTVGTPFYMAPEQFDDSQVDARADIYAAGVVLFHLLSGHAPFQGSGHQVAQKHRGAPIPDLDDGLQVPVAVESTMRRAMAKSPERRYGTARLMYAALGAAIGQPAEGPPRSTSRMRSRAEPGALEDDTLEVTDPELLRAVAAVSAARATMSAPIGSGRDLMQNAPRRSVMPLPSPPTASPSAGARQGGGHASSTARMPVGVPSALESSASVAAPVTPTPLRRPMSAHGAGPGGDAPDGPPSMPAMPAVPSMPAVPQAAGPALDPQPAGAPVRAAGTLPEAAPPSAMSAMSAPVVPAIAAGAAMPGAAPARRQPRPPADLGGGPAVAGPTRGRGPIPWRRALVAAAVALTLGLTISWAVGGADGVAVWSSTAVTVTNALPAAANAPVMPAAAVGIRAFRAVAGTPAAEPIAVTTGSAPRPTAEPPEVVSVRTPRAARPAKAKPKPRTARRAPRKPKNTRGTQPRSKTGAF